MWEKIEKQRAAGGYPWTHLNHNCSEEVWINPLKLPEDISKETLKRRDGTLPSEWFHLPSGAETPSVDELMRDSPSPEPEIELEVFNTCTTTDEEVTTSSVGRKTPSGRRTPICGKHRHRHKSSGGSSPAPSVKQQRQSTSTPPKKHQRTLSQPDNLRSTPSSGGHYEPVAMSSSKSVGKLPQSRLPDSELPTLPTTDHESDSGGGEEGCFTMMRSGSRSREGKSRKSPRSQSKESKKSEHPYETPKLLTKVKKEKILKL